MKTTHPHTLLRLVLAAGFALLLGSASAADFTSTWLGGTGNWTLNNWSTSGVFPNNGASTYDAVQNSGTITLDQNITIQKFTFGGSVLGGTSDLTTNDTFTWTSGTIQGSGSINLNGDLTLGNSAVTLTNTRVMNLAAGQTATMSGASTVLNMFDTATFNNNGTFLAQNNQSIQSISAPSNFNNLGTFTRDTGTGTFSISSHFNNSGIVNVNTGTLELGFYSGTGGGFFGTTTGDFNVASGATLRFSDGHTLGATSDVAGAGAVTFASGTVNVNGTFSVPTVSITGGTANFYVPATLSSVTLSSGNLGGSGTVTSNGSFNWSGGQMMGSGTTTLNGGITLGNASLRITDSRVVTLAAGQTAAMSSGSTAITMGTSGTFNNNGTFLAQNDQSISGDGSGQSFNNAGTFTRNTSSGTFNIADVNFTNTGTINADTGTLNIGGSYGSFNMQAGTLTGAGIVNARALNWSGGTFSGTGALNVSGGGNTITSANVKGLDRTLNNTGTITYSSPDTGIVQFGTSPGAVGVINNSGTFNITNGGGFQIVNANADHAINNSGNWNVSGAGTAVVNTGIAFNNSGAVTVAGGSTFDINGGGTQSGSFSVASGGVLGLTGTNLNAGSSVTGAGKVKLGGTTINSGSTYNTSGETSLRGGITTFNTSATTGTVEGGNNQTHLIVSGVTTKLTVNGAFTHNTEFTTLQGGAIIETTAFNLSGGELNGNGSINGPLTATGTGTIAPGASPGHITVNGSTVLGGSNTLAMEVGGLAAGIDYDLLTVNGILTLGGLLDVDFINGFENSVHATDIFTIATATSPILGAFSNVASGTLLSTNFVNQFRVYYGAGSPYGANNLVITEAVPEPSRALLMAGGLLGLVMRRRRRH